MNFYEQIFSRGRATGEGMTHFERLFAAKFGGSPPPEVREYTGAVPVTITADGTPLIDYLISGNTVQSGTPTPDSPIFPQGCGELEISGAKAGQNKIPILSANTTTPIYLGEVQTTRKIKKLVFTGEEAWSSYSGVVYLSNVIDYLKTNSIIVICTHYQSQSSVEGVSETEAGHITFSKGSNYRLCIRDSNYTTGANFKSYLAAQYAAGTPVCVWYVLATEETAVVNEPLMRIGDYADTLSKAQAGVSIPTNNGSTTVDVDTTLKPSEVYIKYMG